MTAVRLRLFLIAALTVLIFGAIAGIYFAAGFLYASARETSHVRSDADMTQSNIIKLQQLETSLTARKDLVDRANNLVASYEGFGYQNRVVEDLNTYARLAGPGVRVTDFTFSDPTEKLPPTTVKDPTDVNIKGIRTVNATVTLNSPIAYTSFLRFLRAIEQNLTKMQITGVNISPDKDIPSAIDGPTINLQVYVKETR